MEYTDEYINVTCGTVTTVNRKLNKNEENREQIFIEQDGNEIYLARTICTRLIELCERWGIK